MGKSVVSTTTLRNIVSSATYLRSARIETGANNGHPEAIFISDCGRWKDELFGSGWNESTISFWRV